MANHSPEKNNYVAKKTWDAALDGKKPDVKPEGTVKKVQAQAKAEDAVRVARNEARGNGGSSADGEA